MNVAVYIRCSTQLQEDSPEVQLGIIREYCAKQGHTIAAVYVDVDVSRSTAIEERPGFSQLIAERKEKRIDAVVILKIDRFSGDMFDFLSFERAAKRHKLQIIYATEEYQDNASGRLMKCIKVLFAEHEVKQTGERIVQHNRHLAMTGRWPSGRPPLGYVYDIATKEIKVGDRAADAVTVFETFLQAHGNRSETAKRLNAMGIRTRLDNLWTDDAIGEFVRNPLFRGIIRYQDIQTEVDIPRIVPKQLLNRVDVFLENAQGKRTRNPRKAYPYSGILICATCGNSYKAHIGNRKNSYSYVCRGHKEKGICRQSAVGSRRIDRLIQDGLKQGLEYELSNLQGAIDTQAHTQRHAERNISRGRDLKDSRVRVIDLYTSGIIDKVELEDRLATIDQQLKTIAHKPERTTFRAEDVVALLDNWDIAWPSLTDAEKRSLVLSICDRIVVRFIGMRISLDIQSKLAQGIITIEENDGL